MSDPRLPGQPTPGIVCNPGLGVPPAFVGQVYGENFRQWGAADIEARTSSLRGTEPVSVTPTLVASTGIMEVTGDKNGGGLSKEHLGGLPDEC